LHRRHCTLIGSCQQLRCVYWWDHQGEDTGNVITPELLTRHLKKGDAYALLDRPEFREDLFPTLMEKTQDFASRQVPGIIAHAHKEMNAQLGHEIARLRELKKVNRSVRSEEIDLLIGQQRALDQHLMSARLRLDSIRLIQRGPA
jgi:hypothetical protein